MDKTQPLGLPQGSVRALLALMITGAVLALTIVRGSIPTDLVPLASVVVTYYFVSRDNAPAPEAKLPEPFVPGDDA